jgi:hypothetical protein
MLGLGQKSGGYMLSFINKSGKKQKKFMKSIGLYPNFLSKYGLDEYQKKQNFT